MIRHDIQHETHHDNVAAEPRDVPIRGILYFLLAMVLTIVGTMAFLVWVFDIFNDQIAAADVGLPPLAHERPEGPPAPRLQADPPLDLAALRAGEAKRLSSYGWISPQEEIVHIPIERAKELVLEEMPQWPAEPNAQSAEETAPPSQPAEQPQAAADESEASP